MYIENKSQVQVCITSFVHMLMNICMIMYLISYEAHKPSYCEK